ncbi:MAG: acetoacetyl-CoA reductase [Ectothiorhodospiraceae bacterium]|nr:acetoacetyl-CoA reductase [Ectothiorhodospiraceae bacterium]
MNKRVALVTGGNGGIGTEICKQLNASGHRVISTCVDAERENVRAWQQGLAEKGMEVDWVECNVADFDACAAMAEVVLARHGQVDVLVNAAGITRDGFLHKMARHNWESVISINLSGAYNVTRQFIEGMRERGYGRIINISSVNGQAGQFGQTNYSAAKAGLHGFSMALAKEGARKGITANTVSPGYVDTAMTAAMPDEVRNQIVSQIPAGRMARPEEVARVVAFLAEEASAYINGANIPVNGAQFTSF